MIVLTYIYRAIFLFFLNTIRKLRLYDLSQYRVYYSKPQLTLSDFSSAGRYAALTTHDAIKTYSHKTCYNLLRHVGDCFYFLSEYIGFLVSNVTYLDNLIFLEISFSVGSSQWSFCYHLTVELCLELDNLCHFLWAHLIFVIFN